MTAPVWEDRRDVDAVIIERIEQATQAIRAMRSGLSRLRPDEDAERAYRDEVAAHGHLQADIDLLLPLSGIPF